MTSVRVRLLVGNLAVVAVLFGVFAFALRAATSEFLIRGPRDEMERRVNGFANNPGPLMNQINGGPPGQDQGGPGPGGGPRRNGPFGGALSQPEFRPLYLGSDGKPVVPNETRQPWDPGAVQAALAGRGSRTEVNGERHLLIATEPFRFRIGPPNNESPDGDWEDKPKIPQPAVVQFAVPLDGFDTGRQSLDRAILILAPLALLFAGAISWLLTGRVLRPVTAIRESADALGGANLGDRLPVLSSDEFGTLAASFNRLLDRVQSSSEQRNKLLAQLQRFTADASHELKTPLTVIKGTASFARDRELSYSESQAAFAEIDRAATAMQRLVQDLLLLSSADEHRLGQRALDLLVGELYQSAWIECGRPDFEVSIEPADLQIHANENEMTRVLRNLFENAIRYRAGDEPVKFSASVREQRVHLTVRNRCEGLTAEEVSHLGERFYRVDQSRAKKDGGTGLGLAIVTELVKANGGEVTFSVDQDKNFTAEASFPLPAAVQR